MPKEILKRGATSNILRVFLQDSASTTGAGKTALTSTSSGLIISTIADLEATATTYTSAATNVETITTLGTFAAPTASKCRFREVDATNFPGVYEIQIADARFAVANSTQLLISIQCTGVAPVYVEYQLVAVDLMDAVRLGITALPNFNAGVIGGLPLSINTAGAVNTVQINGTNQTARDIGASVLLSSGTGAGQISLASGAVTAGTVSDKTGYSLATAPPTAATIATQVWSEALPGSYTSGQAGFKLNAAGSAADPWSTALPGSYSVGSAGNIIGNMVSNTWAATTRTLTAGTNIVLAKTTNITGFNDITPVSVWDVLASAVTTTSSIGLQLKTNVDTQVSSRMASFTYTAPPSVTDIWNTNISAYSSAGFAGTYLKNAMPTFTYTAPLTSTQTAQAVWNALTTDYTTANTFGQRVLRSTTSQSSCAVTGSNHIAADVHQMQPDVVTASAVAADATAEIADRVLGRTISGGADGGRTVTSALRILRNKFTASSTTLTVYAEDDVTTAWTSTLTTDSGAIPITGSDPA